MNKKLLFGIMSLAALTACTNDDFESKQVAQEASPIQFEVLNNDAATRASMDENKIVWNANDGDIFTLYHGGAGITGFENAIYTAKANEGSTATLTTPTMIKQGLAVMVWPVDTTFRIKPADNLSIKIDADQKADIENYIPYMSDQITIGVYGKYNEDPAKGLVTAWNTAGKDRKYPVFMRPMASQLIVKADYAGTDETLAALETGDDPIEPIKVTSVKLLTKATGVDKFTTNLDVKWTAPTPAINTQWASVAHNAWTAVTDFDKGAINASSDYLETECLTGNESAKFLILPQANIAGGVDDGAVVVNTIYGKVFIGDPTVYAALPNKSYYTAAQYNQSWYRYISAASKAAGVTAPGSLNGYDASETVAATAGSDGKFKTTSKIENGLMQTINVFSNYTHQAAGVVKGEPEGVAGTRYVEVRLDKLDMSDLHIKSDKQLRDAAKVWIQMGLADVTVFLDGGKEGDAPGEFTISQTTIDKINEINATPGLGKSFKVKPCTTAGEVCNTIVITGGGNIKDLTFIKDNGGTQAAVAFKAGENWKWAANNTVKVASATCGISKFINRGTFTSDATATINVKNDLAVPAWVNIPFENAKGAEWNITGATINVQFNVTNYGTVNIAKGAQYRQDGRTGNTEFFNEAKAIPSRFNKENPVTPGLTKDDTEFGLVNNFGVFATVEKAGTYTAKIHNYGLIEHKDPAAKTFITTNQTTTPAVFNAVFAYAPGDAGNKMGRINLPYDNRGEDNVSISAAGAGTQGGFVSVTINGEVTGALEQTTDELGNYVNYVIVNAGPTSIASLSNKIKYLEVNMTDKSELAWSVAAPTALDGLMILTDVNIKLGTTVTVTKATYLGADMYVGGTFNHGSWTGYYGNTTNNVDTKYITY